VRGRTLLVATSLDTAGGRSTPAGPSFVAFESISLEDGPGVKYEDVASAEDVIHRRCYGATEVDRAHLRECYEHMLRPLPSVMTVPVAVEWPRETAARWYDADGEAPYRGDRQRRRPPAHSNRCRGPRRQRARAVDVVHAGRGGIRPARREGQRRCTLVVAKHARGCRDQGGGRHLRRAGTASGPLGPGLGGDNSGPGEDGAPPDAKRPRRADASGVKRELPGPSEEAGFMAQFASWPTESKRVKNRLSLQVCSPRWSRRCACT